MLALARHVVDELAIEAVEQLLQVLAGRAGVAGLGEGVGRALVLVALAALDLRRRACRARRLMNGVSTARPVTAKPPLGCSQICSSAEAR